MSVGKKITFIALMVITMASTAFAGDNGTLEFKGADRFRKMYPHATKVSVQIKNKFTEVKFTWNGMELQAFYDKTGNLIGTSRNIAVNDLPLAYVLNIKREYDGYEVTEAIEFDHAQDGLSYYVSVSNGEQAYVLNISTNGDISVFKRLKY